MGCVVEVRSEPYHRVSGEGPAPNCGRKLLLGEML
jgi:hypothetical protein